MADQNLYDRYENAVATINIPAVRKLASSSNTNWFRRNAWLTDKFNRKFNHARSIAIKIANSY